MFVRKFPITYPEAMRIFKLALPIVVSMSASMLIGVIDTIMIAPLGTVSLGAASVTSSVLIIFYAGLYGLASISSVLAAQIFGASEHNKISALFYSIIKVSLVAGSIAATIMILSLPLMGYIGQPVEVIEIITPYWICMALLLVPFTVFYALKGIYDSVGQAWIAVIFSFIAVAINVPANLILIHGLGDWNGYGLMGAGIASLLSQASAILFLLIHWFFSKRMVAFGFQGKFKTGYVKDIIKDALPVGFGYMSEAGAFALAGLMIGWFGATALAANQIVTSIAVVLYMMPLGISTAASIRVGNAIGAGDTQIVRMIGFTSICLVTLWMGLVTTSLLILGDDIANLLASEPEVALLATTMFIVVAIMQVGDGIQATSLGALRGMLDTRWPVMVTLAMFWLISLPTAYILSVNFGLGANGVWIGYGSGLFFAATILTIRFEYKTRV